MSRSTRTNNIINDNKIYTYITILCRYIEQMSSGLVFGKLNPLLKLSRPRWIADIGIHSFKLGKVAPQVTSVKVAFHLSKFI